MEIPSDLSTDQPAFIWFRHDLRLDDQYAVATAAHIKAGVTGVYILDEGGRDDWKFGGASRWWLHHTLERLAKALSERGSSLVLARGNPRDIFASLLEALGPVSILATAHDGPFDRKREEDVASLAKETGGVFHLVGHNRLYPTGTITTNAGTPYKVFTPFWRSIGERGEMPNPIDAPGSFPVSEGWAEKVAEWEREHGDRLGDWQLLPTAPNWAEGFNELWQPGEAGAREQLDRFLEHDGPQHYGDERDRPDKSATSQLSPHLSFGEISPRRVWAETMGRFGNRSEPFLRQLGWRDFSWELVRHNPDFMDVNWRSEFDHFEWEQNDEALTAWKKGKTGYPIVDAGMRQLWQTGWMHNRVRMIVASFLIKDLLIHWREGELWFWDTLVDADLGNNAAGWQWVAGSGADASPFFRIFNPVSQGEKFDPEGAYVRKFVPELKNLPQKYIHAPWTAPARVLADAGVKLGADYPKPIVDHKAARERALEAYKSIKAA
ncbi:MAG: deoxyribodipyrimidine photo-lyase [Pseudomonadota bacterium]